MNRRDAIKALGVGAVSAFGSSGGALVVPLERAMEPPACARGGLCGGFIEFRNAMMNFGGHWGSDAAPEWTPYPIDWPAVLESMRRIGMRTVIIKSTAVRQWENGQPVTYSFYRAGHDAGPTRDILAYADAHGMEVFVGLADDPTFGFGNLTREYLIGRANRDAPHEEVSALGRNQKAASEVWPFIKDHPSFAGWYIPNEIWNFSEQSEAGPLLNEFYCLLTAYLRQRMVSDSPAATRTRAASRLVAISPYFNREYLKAPAELASPEGVRGMYHTILAGSGIDIQMVQDSYAVRGYDPDLVAAFAAAARSAGVRFWMNVENFAGNCPAPFARFGRQIEMANAHDPERLVTFDFFHYMNPVVPDCCPQPGAPPVLCSGPAAAPCRDAYGGPVVEAGMLLRRRLYDEYSASR